MVLLCQSWRSHRGRASPPTVTPTPTASLGRTGCPAGTDGLPAWTTLTGQAAKSSFTQIPTSSSAGGIAGNPAAAAGIQLPLGAGNLPGKWCGVRTVPSVGHQSLPSNLKTDLYRVKVDVVFVVGLVIGLNYWGCPLTPDDRINLQCTYNILFVTSMFRTHACV